MVFLTTAMRKRGLRLRTAGVLLSALALGACASGVTKPVPPLVKGEASEASASLYAHQKPPVTVPAEVIRALETQVTDTPSDPMAYLRLGVAYRHAERFDEALQVFEQAAVLGETPSAARNEIGILYRTQGEFEKAEEVYQQLLVDAPQFFDAHFNLGILYDLYLRRPLDAHAHYQAYMNKAPEADERVEKWLVDLQRRHQIDASATAGVVND